MYLYFMESSKVESNGNSLPLAEQRLNGWVGALLASGWAKSERSLAQELGLSPTVFYKVRNGLQRFPAEGLLELSTQFGLQAAYIREGQEPAVMLPKLAGVMAGDSLAARCRRLRLLAVVSDIDIEAMKIMCGIDAGQLLDILNLKAFLPPTNLVKLRTHFPGLSTDWLITGRGVAFRTGGGILEGGMPPAAPAMATPSGPGIRPSFTMVPYVALRARASFVSDYIAGVPYAQLEARAVQIDPSLVNLKEPLLIDVEGDSMMPTLIPGDRLLVTAVPATDWRYESEGVYVVIYGEDYLVVKRIKQNRLSTEGFLTLSSDNPEGGEVQVAGEDIRGMYKLRQLIRVWL
jgi:phage repressor protein C with HTH and peptisase S24 domain